VCRRLLRLFPNAHRARLCWDVLIASLPGLAAVATLASVLLIVYSLVGMALFGTLLRALPVSAAAMPSKRADFSSFGAALLTMLRLLTLDGWTAALQQLLRCEGVEYLFGGVVPYAQRCDPSPVRCFVARGN
jgi:hypothetical protein